ncbi:uncharacterized protein [Physcomitrium patens]|uniref:Uncharacterized protein n=1 Tax=Physcomitrium patens TaxID=3218 RepID=A0A2K1IUQ1_PHYPA|nr:protein EMBRYO DEFECTIVE 514-like [Physcomitrium patens]PNR33009.1 hypothetical protein PHYPA_024952 [Physcomitrium patens]|eukprot:XP_024358555.1 protein EMBRYO DEFECTIVE 514-like [Physcomitrella patens]
MSTDSEFPLATPVEDVAPEVIGNGVGDGEKEAAQAVEGADGGNGDEGGSVTVVSETTVVEEVVVAAGEDSVKVDETVSVTEAVTVVKEEMETDGNGDGRKRIRDEEESDGVKRVKSEDGEADGTVGDESKPVEAKKLGPKVFETPVKMFSYFYNLLHDWQFNVNVNKYEYLVLSELVAQGNPQKVGDGIAAFQIRNHPEWKSRCYYLIRKDGSEEDFSYRKCVDALMPLPANLYRSNGQLDLEKLFPGQRNRHRGEQREQNGDSRGGGRWDRGGRGGGGGGRGYGGRGGGGRGGRGGGGRRGGRGRW